MNIADLRRAIDDLEVRIARGECDAPLVAQALREEVMSQPSQLLKARYLLTCNTARNTSRPMRALIDDLLLALRIFRANGDSAAAARCLVRLCDRFHLQGWDLAALAAGQAALHLPELRAPDRLVLVGPMCVALTQQLRPAAAWELLDELLVQLHGMPRTAEQDARLTRVRASLHFVEALRAARVPSIYCLDLAAGPRDLPVIERHLAASDELHARARLLAPGAPVQVVLQILGSALRGDIDGAVDALRGQTVAAGTLADGMRSYNIAWCLRVGGRAAEAVEPLLSARQIVGRQPAGKCELLVEFELTQVWARLGRWEQACAAHERLAALRARLQSDDLAAIRLLRGATGDEPGVSPLAFTRAGDPRSDHRRASDHTDAALRGSDPPCLPRAERVLQQSLPRRLGPAALAQQAGVSLRTLQHAVRTARGLTLSEWIRQGLMGTALHLLTHTDLSLREIATRCGYRDAPAFSRDFKRVHGSAPGQHRTALRACVDH